MRGVAPLEVLLDDFCEELEDSPVQVRQQRQRALDAALHRGYRLEHQQLERGEELRDGAVRAEEERQGLLDDLGEHRDVRAGENLVEDIGETELLELRLEELQRREVLAARARLHLLQGDVEQRDRGDGLFDELRDHACGKLQERRCLPSRGLHPLRGGGDARKQLRRELAAVLEELHCTPDEHDSLLGGGSALLNEQVSEDLVPHLFKVGRDVFQQLRGLDDPDAGQVLLLVLLVLAHLPSGAEPVVSHDQPVHGRQVVLSAKEQRHADVELVHEPPQQRRRAERPRHQPLVAHHRHVVGEHLLDQLRDQRRDHAVPLAERALEEFDQQNHDLLAERKRGRRALGEQLEEVKVDRKARVVADRAGRHLAEELELQREKLGVQLRVGASVFRLDALEKDGGDDAGRGAYFFFCFVEDVQEETERAFRRPAAARRLVFEELVQLWRQLPE